VQAAFRIRELVAELERPDSGSSARGDSSFLEGGTSSSAPSEWPVAILEECRSTDPKIIKADLSAVSQDEREVERVRH
jgi:hypothetical protein